MSVGTDLLKDAFRDHNTAGIPASGPHEPVKAAIRAALDRLSIDLAAASVGDPAPVIAALTEAYDRLDDIDLRGIVGAGTIAEREAYTYRNGGTPDVPENAVWIRKDAASGVRLDVWVTAGNKHPRGDGSNVTYTGWHGLKTEYELDNLAVGKWNQLPQANVAGLASDFTRYDARTLNARIDSLRARALGTGSEIAALVEWEGHGDRFELTWDGYTVALGGDAQRFDTTLTDWSSETTMLFAGDSILHDSTLVDAAADVGLGAVIGARSARGGKQAFFWGVRPLYFTTQTGTIPAAGTPVRITSINGITPSPDIMWDLWNPATFLNTATGDTTTTDCDSLGVFGGRHIKVYVPNAGTPEYWLVADDGVATATPVGAQSLFVPDLRAQLGKHPLTLQLSDNVLWVGPGNPDFSQDINPRVFEDIGLFIAATRGQRVILMAPEGTRGDDFKTGGPFAAARTYFYNQLLARWPNYTARLQGVTYNGVSFTGNKFDFLRQFGSDGSANDLQDIADGLQPRSILSDGWLHYNAKGKGLRNDFWKLFYQRQRVPPAVRPNTSFDLAAFARNNRTASNTTTSRTTIIESGFETGVGGRIEQLSEQVSGALTSSDYKPTLQEAIDALDPGSYFNSDDQAGVGPHPGVRWIYRRIEEDPGYEEVRQWGRKEDVGLRHVDDTSDAQKVVEGPIAEALGSKAGAAQTAEALQVRTIFAPSRVVLAAVEAAAYQTAYLNEGGTVADRIPQARSGNFVFVPTNCSAKVATDPMQGVWVAPLSDPTGASGAWRRQATGSTARAEWWGAAGIWTEVEILAGTADDSIALKAAIAFCEANPKSFKRLQLACGNFVADNLVLAKTSLVGTIASRSLSADPSTDLGTRLCQKIGARGDLITMNAGDGWEEVSDITLQGFKTQNLHIERAKAITAVASRTQFTVAVTDLPEQPSNYTDFPHYGLATIVDSAGYILGTAIIRTIDYSTGVVTIASGYDNYATKAGASNLLTTTERVIFAPRGTFTVSGAAFTDVSDSTRNGNCGVYINDRTKVLHRLYVRDFHCDVVIAGSVVRIENLWSVGPTMANLAMRSLGAGSDYNFRGLFFQGYNSDGLGAGTSPVATNNDQYKTTLCSRWGLGAKETFADLTADQHIHGVIDKGSAGIQGSYLHIDKPIKEAWLTTNGVYLGGLADATVHINALVVTSVGQNQTMPSIITYPSGFHAIMAIRPGSGRILAVGSLSCAPWSPDAPADGYFDCITHIKSASQGESRITIGQIGSLKGCNGLWQGDYGYNTPIMADSVGVALRDSSTANANSTGRLFGGAYSGNRFTAMQMLGSASDNEVRIGGGTSLAEPATAISLYAGASGSLGTGTRVMQVTSSRVSTSAPLVVRDSSAASANATGRIQGGAYTGNPFSGINLVGTSGSNDIRIGGGTALYEPATSVGIYVGNAGAAGTGARVWEISTGGHLVPGADNSYDVGAGGTRVRTVYAASGTINTSDERVKVRRSDGSVMPAELRAWGRVRPMVYWNKASHDVKGEAARLHVGWSWQEIAAAFEAEGLDAARYGLWCEDEHMEPVDRIRIERRPVMETIEESFEEVQVIEGRHCLVIKGLAESVRQMAANMSDLQKTQVDMLVRLARLEENKVGDELVAMKAATAALTVRVDALESDKDRRDGALGMLGTIKSWAPFLAMVFSAACALWLFGRSAGFVPAPPVELPRREATEITGANQ